MASDTMPAVVLKVTCGQVLNTTMNGVVVQIECNDAANASPKPWTPPEPPSGAGGTVAFAEIPRDVRLLDLGEVLASYREGMLDDRSEPLEPGATATVV